MTRPLSTSSGGTGRKEPEIYTPAQKSISAIFFVWCLMGLLCIAFEWDGTAVVVNINSCILAGLILRGMKVKP
jgi:hypothetical protein